MFCKVAVTLALILFSATTLHAQAAPPTVFVAPPADPPTAPPASISTKLPHTEDWTTISLAKSNLPLADYGGVLLSKVEMPDCTRELVRLQWRRGDPIDIYVIRPRGIDKPPVALYLLNYTTDIDGFRDELWCRQVKRDGVAVVGFVSALAGQRFHLPRPMKEWFVSELQEALSTSTHDVQMILNYLATRDDLDMKHVGMLGHGSGGSVAILAAAADPRIVALHVIDPWGDWPDWLKGSKQIPEAERATYLKPKFLEDVANLDPVLYLPQCKCKALRIEQLTNDPVTPPVARDKIAGAAPRTDVVQRYPDRSAEVQAWGPSGVSTWLAAQLKPNEPGKE